MGLEPGVRGGVGAMGGVGAKAKAKDDSIYMYCIHIHGIEEDGTKVLVAKQNKQNSWLAFQVLKELVKITSTNLDVWSQLPT